MEIRQLASFVAVAETGGFGRAAERMHLVQPAVSQQVSRLERELGVRLFDRSTRHVRLTEAGERLLPEARAVLAAADRTRQVAAEVSAELDAVLRVGASPAPGPQVFEVMDALAQQVRVRLTKAPLADRLAAVRTREVHAAFVRIVDSAPGLELLPAWSDPLVVALPADHPLAVKAELKPADLDGLPVRLAPRDNNAAFHDLITGALLAAGVEAPRGPSFTNLRDTLTDLAAGPPSWAPFYSIGELPAVRGVAFVPLVEPQVTTYVAVVQGPPAAPVRLLLDAIARTDLDAKRT